LGANWRRDRKIRGDECAVDGNAIRLGGKTWRKIKEMIPRLVEGIDKAASALEEGVAIPEDPLWR
jgi:hypothetical protein